MPTLVFAAGAEQGTPAGLNVGPAQSAVWDAVSGTIGAGSQVDVTTDSARSGTYGYKLTAVAATVCLALLNSANNGVLGSAGTLVKGFQFRFPSLPLVDFQLMAVIGTAGGQDITVTYIAATSVIRVQYGAGTARDSSITIAANTWYLFEFKAVMGTIPGTFDWSINGTAQTQATGGTSSQSLFKFMIGRDSGTQTGTLHVDDAAASLTAADYPLGSHKILAVKADSAATPTQIGTANSIRAWTANGGTVDGTFIAANVAAALDEIPPTLGSSADGIEQVTSGSGNATSVPMTTYTLAGGESISGCRVLVCTWANAATAAANNIGVRGWNGSAETTLFIAAAYQGVNTSTPAWICKMYAGVTSQATLDALEVRIGFSTDVLPLPGAHTAYAEIVVKESAGVFTGTAALSVASTITAAGSTAGAASSSIAATITAAGQVARFGAATASNTANVSATGATGVSAAATTLAVSAAITASGVVGTSSGSGLAVAAATAAAGSANYGGAATLAGVATVSAAGSTNLTQPASPVTITAAIAATGATGVAQGASAATVATITAAGVAAVAGAASSSVTATVAATGGTTGGAALSATATVSAAGVVGRSAGAMLVAATTLSAAGTAAVTGNATLAVTAGIAAAGTAVTGFSGTATLPVAATTVATGVVAKTTGASLPVTAAVTAAGSTATAGVGALPVVAAIGAAGVVGVVGDASRPVTATVAAAGVVARNSAATLTVAVVITASGVVSTVGTASAVVAVTIDASGMVSLGRGAALLATVGIVAAGVVTAGPIIPASGQAMVHWLNGKATTRLASGAATQG